MTTYHQIFVSERISPEEKTLASSWPDELKLKKINDNLLDDEDEFYDEDYEEDDDLYDDEDEDDYYDDEEYYEDEYDDEEGKVDQFELNKKLILSIRTLTVNIGQPITILINIMHFALIINYEKIANLR